MLVKLIKKDYAHSQSTTGFRKTFIKFFKLNTLCSHSINAHKTFQIIL